MRTGEKVNTGNYGHTYIAFDYQPRGVVLLLLTNFTCWLYLISVGWLIRSCTQTDFRCHWTVRFSDFFFTHSLSSLFLHIYTYFLISSFAKYIWIESNIIFRLCWQRLNLFEWIKSANIFMISNYWVWVSVGWYVISSNISAIYVYNIVKTDYQYVFLLIHSFVEFLNFFIAFNLKKKNRSIK